MTLRLLLFFFLFAPGLFGQDPMIAVRCDVIGYDEPVLNIFVNEQKQTWVGTSKGLYRVYDPSLGEKIDLKPGQQSLLQIPDGNYDIQWSIEKMEEFIGNNQSISTGFYQSDNDQLWIGTKNAGIFLFNTKPNLQLIESFTVDNSKLQSNSINKIIQGPQGRLWIATPEGVMVGTRTKWKLMEKYMDITDLAVRLKEVWVLSEGEVFIVDEKDNWYTYDIPVDMQEGSIRGISFDDKGVLWMASRVVTRYNIRADVFQVFGPAEYFTSEFATRITRAPDDKTWIGTADKGLYLIEKEEAMTVSILIEKFPTCNGPENSASLLVRTVGGIAPYSYAWNAPIDGKNPVNIPPGEYSVTVSDISGKKETASVIIPTPGFSVSTRQEKPESPEGLADGVALVSVSDGTPPFSYQWDNGETEATAKNLTAGKHQVTVTDQNNCSKIGEVQITREIGQLTVLIELTKPIQCNLDSSAAITAAVSGGKPPFSFSWKGNDTKKEILTNIPAGLYAVSVSDQAGNTATADFKIEQPEPLSLTIIQSSPAETNQQNGQATATPNGGKPPYSFAWDNGENEPVAYKLAPGVHQLTITDDNGCTLVQEVTITEDVKPLTVLIELTKPIQCNLDSSAAITASVSGGKPPFSFSWNGNDTKKEILTNIPAGLYAVSVSDQAGNTATADFKIEQPEPLSLTIIQSSPAETNQQNGQATATPNGGTPPYSFAWDNGENESVANKLAPGIHQLTITDTNGCQSTQSVTISEDIKPLQLSVLITKGIRCAGQNEGEIEVQVTGGKPPFQYRWSSEGLQASVATNLGPGTFHVTVTDAAGQEAAAFAEITTPDALTAQITNSRPAASDNSNDGKAEVLAEGGTPPYAYAWSNGEKTANPDSLSVGIQTVTVTDGNGCITQATVEIKKRILPELSASQLQEGQTIRMQTLQFEADSFNVNRESVPVIEEVAQFLKDNANIVVEIGGHTNGIPEHAFCDWLSTERAKAVAEYIVQQMEIDGKRVYYQGYGKRKPIASNQTEEGRKLNQRVEVKILSVKGVLEDQ